MVKVKIYGLLRLDTGLKELDIEAKCVSDIYPALLEKAKEKNHGKAFDAKDFESCIVLINGIQKNRRAKLGDGDLVTLMSPVCGG